MGGRAVVVVVLIGWVGVACSSPSSSGAVGNGGSSGATTNPGGASSGGSSSSGGDSSSSGGDSSSSGGSSSSPGGDSQGAAGNASHGGLGPANCDGDFGAETVVLSGEPGVQLASPALSPDTLELFYVRTSGADIAFRRSTRAGADSMFAPGAAVPELDAACTADQSRTIGLSSDGLRAYIVCYASDAAASGLGTLHVAERHSLTATFEMRAGTASVGPSAAISSDELTLYTSSDVSVGRAPPRRYRRATQSGEFGSGEDIPGLSDVNLSAPDPSPDELVLFGALSGDLVQVTRATRDADFGKPQVVLSHTGSTFVYGAPEISRDCRSLFFVKATPDGSHYTGEILVIRR